MTQESSPAATRPPGQSATVVVVVGAGIAGLAAATRLRELDPQLEVVVLEGGTTVGGKLRLAEVGGVRVDVGAEAILNRRAEGLAMAATAGLGEDIVYPATSAAQLWSRGVLHPLPRTLMGIPVDLRALAEEGVISKKGVARAALDAVLPATSLEGRDTSIGALVEERFGKEVVDRLLEPLLGGVYAGHSREISARAAVPQVVALLDRDRSLSRAAALALAGPRTDVPVFAGIRGGIGRMAAALADRLAAMPGVRIETDAAVRDLARRAEGGWRLVIGSAHDPRLLDCDAVVLATPARTTARLLSDVAPNAALELARIEYASVAIVTLAFAARQFPQVAGSGFLVPPVDRRQIKAVTFSFAKWDWVREAGRQSRGSGGPGDLLVLRASLGRHREEHLLQRTDGELVNLVRVDLADAIGVSAGPIDSHVQRWGGALPQYAVGHLDRVARVRAEVGRLPGVVICGAAYDGLGIPACIASAHRAVDDLLSGTMEPWQ